MRGPDLARLLARRGQDTSGAALAALVSAAHGHGNGKAAGNAAVAVTPGEFMQQPAGSRPWDDIPGTLASEGRNNGVMRLACSLRETTSLDVSHAVERMREQVWPLIDQSQGGHEFPWEEFEEVIRAVWRQYPGAGERAAAAAVAAADLDANPLPAFPLQLTDAFITPRVARILARSGMNGRRYLWARGLGWMKWDTKCWVPADESEIWDEARQYFIWLYNVTARAGADQGMLAALTRLLSKARIAAITSLARGHAEIIREAGDFDAHPDVINTPDGIVDLRTGDIRPHDPGMLLTKITNGSYRPDSPPHPDWEQALSALPADERAWFQLRVGQAITGHPTPDGILPVLQGSGENGKSCLTTDGPVTALGGYADMASPKLISSQRADHSEHSTELADLRGQRLLIGEELTEGRSIDVTVLKRIQDVGRIKARLLYKDNITFPASHSLFVTTNYLPVINETDHGTWRRLALLVFPYTYRKPGAELTAETDRTGDPGLKLRIRQNTDGQHDAIVTWAIEGAKAWYAANTAAVTREIAAATLRWRTRTDYILAFWHDRLQADQGVPGEHPPCISASHLWRVFNAWIRETGNAEWTNATFTARFGSHEMTTGLHVRYVITERLGNLSKDLVNDPQEGRKRPVKQARAWMGVRFKTTAEQDEWPKPDAPDGSLPTLYKRASYEKVDEDPSAPSAALELETPNRRVNLHGAYPEPVTDSDENQESPQQRKTPKQGKAPRPDPALEGAILLLPAVVSRDQVIVQVLPEDAAALIRHETGGTLTVDVETTGYPPGHPDYGLRTIQLGGERIAVVFDAHDPASRAVIRDLLASARVLHAHSAVADLVPLAIEELCGESAWERMHDTVLPAKLSDPAASGSDADGLKELARDVLKDRAVTPAANEARKNLFASGRWLTDTGALTPRERSGWAQVNPACETMIRYAASDVLDTAALPAVLPQPDPVILARERDIQRICARVSYRGLRLDAGRIRELIRVHEEGKANAAGRVRALGVENPGSARQVAARLVELGADVPRTAPSGRFPEGQLSVTGTVLDSLAGDGEAGELAATVLEYREHATILGLTLEPFRLLCDRGDGRVRPVVYTLGTSTGRMSCVRPNLQQIKRTGGIRGCVTADDGMMIISADFAGVELRVAAALSGDEALKQFILDEDTSRGDKDAKVGLHWKIAHQVWGPEATKQNRYAVKRAVFGHIYGGSAKAMANGAGISLADAEAVKETLAELTPALMRWSADWSSAVRDGRAASYPAWGGRQIWFDSRAPHKAGNYAIQGTARELLCAALLNWANTRWGDSVILPVHDEILATVPAAEAAEATAELVRCMETDLFGVRIVAEPSEPSFCWQDAD